MPSTKAQRLQIALAALERIAQLKDREANAWLAQTGTFQAFLEPASVAIAREALRLINLEK